MILADTSVWIDYFAFRETREVARLDIAIGDREIVLGDLILLEVLQGARSVAKLREVANKLGQIPCMVLGGPALAPKAAANYRALRQRGITVRGTIDVVIATWCIENGARLLHGDRDFDAMERHLGLTVWR